MAPEVVKKQSHGLQADIFVMGVMLFELLYRRRPFSSENDRQFLIDVQKSNVSYNLDYINFSGNSSVSKEIQHLIKSMLKEDPN